VERIVAVARVTIIAVLLGQLGPAVALGDDPKPTPTPPPPPGVVSFTAEQLAAVQAIAQATSLAVRIDAERKLAASERAFVDRRLAQLRAEREQIVSRIAALQHEAGARRNELDRIVQREYRESRRSPLEVLLSTGSILSALVATDALGSLADAEREALAALQKLETELAAQRADLLSHEAVLAGLADSLAAKDALLATLSAQAEKLTLGGSAAAVGVLRDQVDLELAAAAKVDQLVAAAAAAAGAPALGQAMAWVWPAKGTVSQRFGPSALALEPPRTFHGVTYPSFHDGLDIAAPLGTPVVAAAAGRVAFVGHLPDGAEVVLLAHDGGLFTLYAHLDDTHAPPPIKTGDSVKAGGLIGIIGLTGITTGPHLHFVIRRGDEPIDPSGLLPPS
jgi:murein DD-endopeptidase MepM/ murein hydrolase activator NlpD